MTIETSPPPAAPKSGSTADSRSAKVAGRDQKGDGSGGFMAVLAAVEDPQEAGVVQLSEDFEQKVALAPVDAAQAASDLIANAMLPASAVPASGALPVPLEAQAGGLAGAKSTTMPGLNAAARHTGGTPADADALQGDGKALFGGKLAKTAKNAQVATSQTAANPSAAEPAKEHDTRFLAALEAMKAVQFGREPVAAAVAAVQVLAATDRPGDELRSTKLGAAGGSAHTPQAGPEATFSMDAGIGSASAEPAIAPEMQVAQQVTYWISQDVQNAEMTLDGLGKEAVEVSIRMHGNEAHVAFRTDEVDTRGVLEGAAAHLKDMLQREGLVLSGVSVGTSGAGSSAGEERKQQRSAARQAQVLPAAVAGVEGRRAMGGQAGRTLDLFV